MASARRTLREQDLSHAPLEHGALSPLGQRLQLPLLRAGRHPVAVRLRNSDVFTSFIMCFLPILGVYYPLLMFGIDRAKSGDLPPLCVWLGNLMLALAGFWQLRKVIRY